MLCCLLVAAASAAPARDLLFAAIELAGDIDGDISSGDVTCRPTCCSDWEAKYASTCSTCDQWPSQTCAWLEQYVNSAGNKCDCNGCQCKNDLSAMDAFQYVTLQTFSNQAVLFLDACAFAPTPECQI